MDLSMIMNPALIPAGTLGLVLEPAALFTAWLGLVVTVLAGLTSVLGMEGGRERSDRCVARPPHIGSRPPHVHGAAA